MFGRHFRPRPHGQEDEATEFPHRGGWRHHGFPHRHGGHEHDRAAWFAPERHEHFGRFFGRGGPFGEDPFDEDGGPGRRRQRRGDIKYALLELLAQQPRHGYEMIKELEQRYGGFYRPSPGSVYPTLQLLEDEGHLTSETIEGKRVYTITESGRQLVAERQQHHEDEGGPARWRGFRRGGSGPELHEMRQVVMALLASVMELARHGTPEQVHAVAALLDSTRREIYAILSQSNADRQE